MAIEEVVNMDKITCEITKLPSKLCVHGHTYAQLVMSLEGQLHIKTNTEEYYINNQYLGFLPPNCIHAYKGDKINKFLVVNIPEHMIKKEDAKKIIGGNKFIIDERWKAIETLLIHELKDGVSPKSLNYLFFYIYDLIYKDIKPKSINYIKDNFAADINVKTLADIEHYNVNYYTEWFRKKMGSSPLEYIQNIRIEKAKELLVNTNYTILEVAQQVGYSHNSSFSRIFKSMEKISPATYRKLYRELAK